ncbi:hypothetical protein LINPERPRIM_LOCUS20069 [Linum perenne]
MNRASFQLSIIFMLLVISFCTVEGIQAGEQRTPTLGWTALKSSSGVGETQYKSCKKIEDCNVVCARKGCTPYNCTALGWCWCIFPKSGSLVRC